MSGHPTTVYSAYGPDGICLYIGVADDFARRKDAHRYSSVWAPYVTQWGTVLAPTRREALDLETLLIRERKPLFNVSKNRNRVANPLAVLAAAVAKGLGVEEAALLAQYQKDGDDLAYTAAASSLGLRGIA